VGDNFGALTSGPRWWSEPQGAEPPEHNLGVALAFYRWSRSHLAENADALILFTSPMRRSDVGAGGMIAIKILH